MLVYRDRSIEVFLTPISLFNIDSPSMWQLYVSITLYGVQYFFRIKLTDLKLGANCNELKSLDKYLKHIRKPLGLNSQCIECGRY